MTAVSESQSLIGAHRHSTWSSSADVEFLYQAEGPATNLRSMSVTYPPGYSPFKRVMMEQAVARINGVLGLRPGWDGLTAKEVTKAAATTASAWLDLLADDDTAVPQVFPLPSGGIQVEWLAAGDGLEVEVSPAGSVGILGVDSAGSILVEGDYPYPDGTSFVRAAKKHLAAISMAAATAHR